MTHNLFQWGVWRVCQPLHTHPTGVPTNHIFNSGAIQLTLANGQTFVRKPVQSLPVHSCPLMLSCDTRYLLEILTPMTFRKHYGYSYLGMVVMLPLARRLRLRHAFDLLLVALVESFIQIFNINDQ